MTAPSTLLRSGPGDPVATTPPRVPGSVRRTVSFDMCMAGGLGGEVTADIRGRDLLTPAPGESTGMEPLEVDSFAMDLRIDASRGEIGHAEVDSPTAPAPQLAGTAAMGIGRRLAEQHPDRVRARQLLYSALEDLGGALLVSGYAPLHAGLLGRDRAEGEARARAQSDICAGWAAGSPVLETLRVEGYAALPIGPPAPVLETDDELGWHAMASLGHPSVRRRRRIDVSPADPAALPGQGEVLIQSHLRDSFAADDGEIVMHEYLLDATVGSDGTIREISVQPRVLPWHECPAATASAQRLVGTQLRDTPARVRAELTGPSTCTHLNSTLRCLADAHRLAEHISTASQST